MDGEKYAGDLHLILVPHAKLEFSHFLILSNGKVAYSFRVTFCGLQEGRNKKRSVVIGWTDYFRTSFILIFPYSFHYCPSYWKNDSCGNCQPN